MRHLLPDYRLSKWKEKLAMIREDAQLNNFQDSEEAEEFWFEDLGQIDYLLIRTLNHYYRFKIVDPERRRGTLMGGCLNNKPHRATLLGYMRKAVTGPPDRLPALKLGVGAAFDVDMPSGKMRVITSPVTEIIIVRVKGFRIPKPPVESLIQIFA